MGNFVIHLFMRTMLLAHRIFLFPHNFSPHTLLKFKIYISSFHTHQNFLNYPSLHFPLSSHTHPHLFLPRHKPKTPSCPAFLFLRHITGVPPAIPLIYIISLFQRYLPPTLPFILLLLPYLFYYIFSILDYVLFHESLL